MNKVNETSMLNSISPNLALCITRTPRNRLIESNYAIFGKNKRSWHYNYVFPVILHCEMKLNGGYPLFVSPMYIGDLIFFFRAR